LKRSSGWSQECSPMGSEIRKRMHRKTQLSIKF